MSRYTGPVCKICRREGMKLFEKGEKCYTEKCGVEKRNYPPGVHVETRGKVTEYGIRLREKQKVKRMYGLSENQFKRCFAMAEKAKGVTGTNLLVFLERRLDNMVYRLGLAVSRKEARQVVISYPRHGERQDRGHPVIPRERRGRDCDPAQGFTFRVRMPWNPWCAGAFLPGWNWTRKR